MSNIIFPTLPGLEWSVNRRPTFTSLVRKDDSLREVAIPVQTRCLYEFDLSYSFLRNRNGATDLQQLLGLFLAMRGNYDTFLFQDPDDFTVVNGQLGTGNGSNRVFILARATGPSYFEAVGQLNTLTNVRWNGMVQSPATYAYSAPNVITFNTAPGNGVVVTATFTFWYVCRFLDELQQYDQFMFNLFSLRSCKFKSVVP